MNTSRYIGIPFVMHGKDLLGCNCWTLLRIIYKEQFNIELPAFAHEFASTKISQLKELGRISDVEREANWIETIKPETGDCVLIRVQGSPHHVGMYLDKRKILHMLLSQPSIIDRVDSPHIERRIIGYYRHKSRA